MTLKEKVKALEEENEFLKAQNEKLKFVNELLDADRKKAQQENDELRRRIDENKAYRVAMAVAEWLGEDE